LKTANFKFEIAGIGLALAVVAWKAGAAQFVDLTADIETVRWINGYGEKPPRLQTTSWTTHCVVGTNSWLIEQSGEYTRDSWWFTGSNVVAHSVVLKYPSDRPELFERNHPEFVVGRGYSLIWESRDGGPLLATPVQLGDFGRATPYLPWLAFCSGPYLKTKDRVLSLPNPRDQGTFYYVYSDTTRAFEDSLGLPIGVEFVSTNQPLCHYRTVGSTNVLGWNFPLEFHIAQYRLNYSTQTWVVDMTASGKVTSIGIGREPSITEERRTARLDGGLKIEN
jgi:hypothetical protein